VFSIAFAVVVWRITGKASAVAAPLGPLLFWAFMWFSTPQRGVVTPKLLALINRDSARQMSFVLLWCFVGIVILIGLNIYYGRQAKPLPVQLAAAVAWLAVFVGHLTLEARRTAQRVRPAVESSAKPREVATAEHWPSE
jgi:hypothetical protein